MKVLKLGLICIAMFHLVSCGDTSKEAPVDAEGFAAIEADIKDKFGAEAYFTNLSITYSASIGSMIGITVTEDPESHKMEAWTLNLGNWVQDSEITLEVPNGTKASDYMYQLDTDISLSKLGDLTAQSIAQLEAEKDLKNPSLHLASINFPDNGDRSKAEYLVMLKPEHGGTTFRFSYALDGRLIKMDY